MQSKPGWMSVIVVVIVVFGFASVAEAARGDGLGDLLGDKGTGALIFAAGLFSIAGGVFAWPFFMNHRKAQFFVRLLGQNGARGLYVVLGAIICFCGVMMMAGKSKPQDASANVTSSR